MWHNSDGTVIIYATRLAEGGTDSKKFLRAGSTGCRVRDRPGHEINLGNEARCNDMK